MQIIKHQLRKLKRFKDDHKALYFFTQTIECLNRWGYPVGLSLLEENYTPINPRLIFLVAFNIVFILINLTSVVARRNEGMVEITLSCLPIGLALQGLFKQYTFYGNYKELRELIYSGVSFYEVIEHEKIKGIARDIAFFGWIIVLHFLRYAYTLAVGCCFFIPIIFSHLFSEKRILPLELEIPFVNERSDFGYWINVLYMGISCIYVTIGLVASDGVYILLLLNGFTQLENIFFELENLDNLTQQEQSDDQTKAISEQLDMIIKQHQKYIRYQLMDKFNLQMI